MLRISALSLLLAVAACSSNSGQSANSPARGTGGPRVAQAVDLTDIQREQVQSAVRARIGNNSATFRTILAQQDVRGTITVCGYFNPGAVDTPFVGTLSRDGFNVADVGGERERTIAVQKACHSKGIYT